MKKIIDGKKYDTDTARKIASFDNGYGGGDFNWTRETLYKTRRGNFFLVGEGGPKSEWAERYGTTYSSGSGLRPISASAALVWLERNGEADIIEEHFSVEEA